MMARLTGLEPATPGVTGRYSNQLSYNRMLTNPGMIARRGSGDLRGPAAAVKARFGKNCDMGTLPPYRERPAGRGTACHQCFSFLFCPDISRISKRNMR